MDYSEYYIFALGNQGPQGPQGYHTIGQATVGESGTTMEAKLSVEYPPLSPATGVTGFSLTADGESVSLTAVTTSGSSVSAVLARPVYSGQTAKLAYSGGNLVDSAPDPTTLTAFSDLPVRNASRVAAPPPQFTYTPFTSIPVDEGGMNTVAITFKVNLLPAQKGTQLMDDATALAMAQQQTVSIPGVRARLHHGDVFTLYGARAMEIKSAYADVALPILQVI